MEPLRINSMLPELNELWDTAKKERRSHGTSYSKNEGHEWSQTNNTIPETLSSSRDWKIQGIEGNLAASQNDLRRVPSVAVTEATPVKSHHINYFSNAAPIPFDKENLCTPQKAPELVTTKTPAQIRCPLSALPLESDSMKDPVFKSDPVQSGHKSLDSLQCNQSNDQKNFFGSSKENKSIKYDSEVFRTPHCKVNINQPKVVPQSRQRLFGVSTSHLSYNVPLHPAVAAAQQQAKQLQQQQNLQHPATPQESLAPRKFNDITPLTSVPEFVISSSEVTPFKSAATSAASSSKVTPYKSAPMSVASSCEVTPYKSVTTTVAASEATPFRSIPKPIIVSSRPTPTHSSSVATHTLERKLQSSSLCELQHKDGSVQEKSHIPARFENQRTYGPSQMSSKKPLESDPQQAQRKLESRDSGMSLGLGPFSSSSNQDLKHHPPQSAPKLVTEPCKDSSLKPVSHVEGGHGTSSDNNKPQAPVCVDPGQKTSGVGQVTVNGKSYTILSFLGRGGSSKVFQVLDPDSSQLKAIKCVNLAETDQSIREGYLNEIKLLADLQDGDCVIRMFDHEHQKQQQMLFVVMEKGDTDLSKLIKDVSKSKKISAAMIIYYWTEMLNAVSFIHKRGTIHSDLKPANFLLVSGRLKLIDFGIASSVQEDMTSVVKDNMTGTYNYISPEALCNTSSDGQLFKIGYKSDVWSLGCILYNLVYGCTPFQHIPNQFQKMNAIVSASHKIQFPEPAIEGCPSVLIQALKSCLVRNPKDRASVDDLLQLPYFEQARPEQGILSQIASLVASVSVVQETEDNPAASVVRSIQRLIIENEKDLPFLGQRR